MVKIVRWGATALVVATIGVLSSSTALAGPAATGVKKIAFVATYQGTATVKVTDAVADITATGTGKGTLLGAGKVTGVGKGDTTAQPCVPFTGPGTLTGKAPTKLMFKVLPGSSACGDEQGNVFSISAKAAVVKGTGKLAKVKGILKLTGTYDREAGTFTVRFAGKLTQP